MASCATDDPEPALHSQLGKTDGEVTNLVGCDTSVLYPVAPKAARPAGAHLQATGTCNSYGVILGSFPGAARWFPVLPASGARVAGGTLRAYARSLSLRDSAKRGAPGRIVSWYSVYYPTRG